jgi:hypothetical protein
MMSTANPGAAAEEVPELEHEISAVPAAESTGSTEVSPRTVGPRELLVLREQEWAPRLRSVSLVAEAELLTEQTAQVARALGRIYASHATGHVSGIHLLLRWPACTAATMVGAAVSGYEAGTYWPALWKAAAYVGAAQEQAAWGQAFAKAVERLGMATFAGLPLRYLGPILMHAGIPAYCLGDYFRLLLDRRRRDHGLDSESFLAWATAPGRESRLSGLDVPARRFLAHGGEYAHDVVDRSFDLLERLSEPDPDFSGIRLPAYFIEEARDELAARRLDVSAARRRTVSGRGRQQRPRIGLDPFGEGVQVILPAVGEAPDGLAVWRVTADGATGMVQSRAMWVGVSEAAPETTYPLSRPVRTVLVSLSGRELTAELQVIDPADPILFFADDGRHIPGTLSLPPGQVWVLHPADRELVVTGEVGDVAEPPVPFGWEGWRLRLVSLDAAEAVTVTGGRSHVVHGQARPRLLLSDPLRGVTTPYGSPVYDRPPRLFLPSSAEALVSWNIDVRSAAGGAPLVSMDMTGPAELDLGRQLPQPLIGAFEVTVRGPLGRGMRRTIFVAERLAVTYQPNVRALSADGLRAAGAKLSAAMGATLVPHQLRFESRERAHVIEYQISGASEPLVITPPHVSLLCAGADATSWQHAPLHFTTEAFAEAGRLLVRVPDGSELGDLEIWVGGERVQEIPSSGQRSPGLAGYELARAGDTIAEHGRAELVLPFAGTSMIAGFVRPRRLAAGLELDGDLIRLLEYRHVDGLMAAIYLVFAPWRGATVLPVTADGNILLPDELSEAGPVRVLLAVEDPWTAVGWPAWPDLDSFIGRTSGVPASADPEEGLLSRFVSGDGDLPEHLQQLERLWQLVHLAKGLVRSGARTDLTERCGTALRRQPRSALLSLSGAGMDRQAGVAALVATGMAAVRPEPSVGQPEADTREHHNEVTLTARLWSALPSAAAVLTGDMLSVASAWPEGPFALLAEDAIAQCGESIRTILRGGDDPHASVGRFGPEAEQMALLSADQVEALWQAAVVVPQALLDADTRTAAARQLFDARRTSEVRRAAAIAMSVVRQAQRLVRSSDYPWLIRQIEARLPMGGSGGWLAVPAMSAALALVARLAARGHSECQLREQIWRDTWAALALRAPDLVAIDLVLAEALIASAEGAHVRGSLNEP